MIKPLIPVGVLLLASSLSLAADELSFSAETIMAWPTRSFEGETEYRLVERDDTRVLQARARQQASAKYLEKEVDLDRTPYLHWCWQVSGIHQGLDETTKAGDDYPARIYVVRKTGILPWQVQSVNYVWASNQPAGSDWPNAFTSRARLLALQGGKSRVGQWVAEVRDVREDFETLFGERTRHIDGVAVMSDGDNAGVDATAWYTHLGFSASDDPPECP
ncbi:DUF3047 domain-containing protein [Halomonas sp. EGI 63088]|uniref:DUF3047 domain-containing protein n=1 Tax=Halomonas flagellata TaxID=2920385 RepID=A0ABS9RRC5_9GAMM|nr:DUF3047 domain-containing protein [Halomonas flagellata]MCH4562407.1 DUF3047 domain-containing protein [Halomonas flagellata]